MPADLVLGGRAPSRRPPPVVVRPVKGRAPRRASRWVPRWARPTARPRRPPAAHADAHARVPSVPPSHPYPSPSGRRIAAPARLGYVTTGRRKTHRGRPAHRFNCGRAEGTACPARSTAGTGRHVIAVSARALIDPFPRPPSPQPRSPRARRPCSGWSGPLPPRLDGRRRAGRAGRGAPSRCGRGYGVWWPCRAGLTGSEPGGGVGPCRVRGCGNAEARAPAVRSSTANTR